VRQRAQVEGIGIGHVDVQEGGARRPHARFAHHQPGIADRDEAGAVARRVFRAGIEDRDEEGDETGRIARDEAGRHGLPAVGHEAIGARNVRHGGSPEEWGGGAPATGPPPPAARRPESARRQGCTIVVLGRSPDREIAHVQIPIKISERTIEEETRRR
jgi:hypothetical protein